MLNGVCCIINSERDGSRRTRVQIRVWQRRLSLWRQLVACSAVIKQIPASQRLWVLAPAQRLTLGEDALYKRCPKKSWVNAVLEKCWEFQVSLNFLFICIMPSSSATEKSFFGKNLWRLNSSTSDRNPLWAPGTIFEGWFKMLMVLGFEGRIKWRRPKGTGGSLFSTLTALCLFDEAELK